MNTYPDVVKGRAIGLVASGRTLRFAARAIGSDPETVTVWWLEYERLCGVIGRVKAMERMKVTNGYRI